MTFDWKPHDDGERGLRLRRGPRQSHKANYLEDGTGLIPQSESRLGLSHVWEWLRHGGVEESMFLASAGRGEAHRDLHSIRCFLLVCMHAISLMRVRTYKVQLHALYW